MGVRELPAQGVSATARNADKPNLDVLRSFAVLAVLVDHTLQTIGIYKIGSLDVINLGLFGVYLFFLHTSLVLMWSLERRPHALDFYIRRAFRIYPLAIAAVVLVATFGLPLAGIPHHPFVASPRTAGAIAANILLIQNLVRQPNVQTVMWTLPLEVQMYLVLPVLFLFARKERTLWSVLILWTLAAAAVQAVMPASANAIDPNIITVVPFFLCGVVAYVAFMRRKARIPSWLFLPLVTVLTLLYMRHFALHSGWVACLFLALALPSFHQAKSRAWVNIAKHLARYSYGIYLLHQWALAAAFYYLPHGSLAVRLLVELAVLCVLVPLAYRYIEEPLIEAGRRVARRVEDRYLSAHQSRIPVDQLQ